MKFPTLHCVVGQRVRRDPDTHRSLQTHSWISYFGLQEEYKFSTVMKVRDAVVVGLYRRTIRLLSKSEHIGEHIRALQRL